MKTVPNTPRMRRAAVGLLLAAACALSACGKTYTRAEFRQLVLNKTEAQVRQAVGEPTWSSDGRPPLWLYMRETYNAKNGNKPDYKVSLTFAQDPKTGQNKVVSVDFAETS